jgi:hypothetical protein
MGQLHSFTISWNAAEKSEARQLLLKAYTPHHQLWQFDTNNATTIPNYILLHNLTLFLKNLLRAEAHPSH